MKSKKILLGAIILILTSLLLFSQNVSIASDKLATNRYFRVTEMTSENSDVMNRRIGYSIGEPGTTYQNQKISGIKIWNIQERTSGSTYNDTDLYCVKSEKGFSDVKKEDEYTQSYDMKKEQSDIVPNIISNISDTNYKGLQALADLMYIPGQDDESKLEELMKLRIPVGNSRGKACEDVSGYEIYQISDYYDLIKAVQQAAVWYFTNSADNADLYDKTQENDTAISWLHYTTDGTNYTNDLADYKENYNGRDIEKGQILTEQADVLYKNLIAEAKNKAQSGDISASTKMTLYTDINDRTGTQPLMEITRDPAKFDLALRKYITNIEREGQPVEVPTRKPSIDTTQLAAGNSTTASYKHRKDPVSVKTGDIVTYNLTIYNEGDKAGRATEIIDQLPTGLQYEEVVNDIFELKSYNQNSNNTLILQRKTSNNDNLDPYAGSGDLDSETIIIKCTVNATANQVGEKILTNVAWISKEFNAVDSQAITNQKGQDRDSEPETAPSVDKDSMSSYKGKTSNKNDLKDSTYYYEGEQDDDDFEKLVLEPTAQFDLKLIKRITAVNGNKVPERIESVDVSRLNTGKTDSKTTADYKLNKDPILVETGDIVTYTFRIYNEGYVNGYAKEITENIPGGLQFLYSAKTGTELDNDTTFTAEEKEAIKFNQNNGWLPASNGNSITTKKLANTVITAFGDNKDGTKTEANLDYEEISVKLKVISEDTTGEAIRNEAQITESADINGNTQDRDSDTNEFVGYEDDEDYDNIVLREFDLKLIKRITEVNGNKVSERIESVDSSKLNTVGEDGKKVTTADYKLNKDPVYVKKGDIVTYTFRVYNEGYIDGYAQEITEDIPKGLEYLWDENIESSSNGTINWDKVTKQFTAEEKAAIEYNINNGWGYADKTLKTIKTDYLSKAREEKDGDNLIKAFGENDGRKTLADPQYYKEVSVKLKVISDDVSGETIRNEAAITEDANKDGGSVTDRDSQPDVWEKYQDDEDYDNIVLGSFDLALRKFIIAVSHDETVNDSDYLKNSDGTYKRAPEVDTSELNTVGEDGKKVTTATYNHTKEPVVVQKGDIVIYMLRVYNEGDIAGYAAEIKDHLPSNLEFVDGDFNDQYGWEVSEDGRTVTTTYLKNSLINAAKTENGEITLSYKEVPIMCKVKDSAISNENITNIADITEYLDANKQPAEDRDSEEDNVKLPTDWPGYKDNETGDYIPGQQDDDDFEKVLVKEFDLALRKWVTQAIVSYNGKQAVSNTGHDAWDDPEEIVKLEIPRGKINDVTIKFKYSIRVYNQGDVEGYAKEITDYIPEGLRFVASDNPGWTDEGNNVISTRLLENRLLQPGEYADIEVILTWINSPDNMGAKINTAEISEDDNPYGLPDKDSTPDNQVKGEDDIDDAPVMLSTSTGSAPTYIGLTLIILTTLAGGIFLIKKYVL